ncbi:GNAT family N-acetyltransferase [Priestia aryabhattai]|uniref:GNAT family N-acetyltransferase n=1 Tax=Priestia aryabhattai TaxID=412384 RepID=UPI001C8E1FC3|nr:GNAT family N-acetyltransferase [Priestia aryabhattai]MBX9966398.1 GNAT family N-acetyltransferase [Priestia aryabhattai]
MIIIKPLSQCSFSDALQAFNKGFEDYYLPLELSLDQFIYRFGLDQLSVDHSFVAFYHDTPAGIILNGIKRVKGRKHAWNGGTSVALPYRKMRIGEALLKATLERYQQQGVVEASLEAFTVNKKAIHLYEKYGYEIVDTLFFLKHRGSFPACLLKKKNQLAYSLKRRLAKDIQNLPFYTYDVPWKNQFDCICDGESFIALNERNEEVGYLLFQKNFSSIGIVNSVTFYQGSVKEHISNSEEVLAFLLATIFNMYGPIAYNTHNVPEKGNSLLVKMLKSFGFQDLYTDEGIKLEQVFMKKQL